MEVGKMKNMLMIVLVLFLASCSTNTTIENVSVEDAQKMIENNEVQVIDVRTQEEFDEGHISGAQLYPLQTIEEMSEELDKDENYLIVCRSGNRSAQASDILLNKGFKNIYNMDGGMNEWTYEIEK